MSYQNLNSVENDLIHNPILNPYPFHENQVYSSNYQRGDVYGNSIPRGYDQSNYSSNGNMYSNSPTYSAMSNAVLPPAMMPNGMIPSGMMPNESTSTVSYKNSYFQPINMTESFTRDTYIPEPDNSKINGIITKEEMTTPLEELIIPQTNSKNSINSNYELIEQPKSKETNNIFLIIFIFIIFFVSVDFWKRITNILLLKLFKEQTFNGYQLLFVALLFTIIFLVLLRISGLKFRMFETLF